MLEYLLRFRIFLKNFDSFYSSALFIFPVILSSMAYLIS